MRCFAAAAAVLLVRGSSLALGVSSQASDDVEQLFVTTCVRYAISLMGKQRTAGGASQVTRNCQIHLSKSGDFCTGYAQLVDRHADQATLSQFCQTEYQKLHAGSLKVTNGTQQIQVHTQTASSHAGKENATFSPEQRACQERVENIIRLRLPHKAAMKVVRLDCAQRFGKQAPLCKDVVKFFGQGKVRDTCKLLGRKRPDMAEFCRRTTGKMVGTGLDGGALREAARDLCEMEFQEAPPLHVHEGCRFYADHLVKAHLDGSSNVSHFCASLTKRVPRAASTGKALHSVPAVKPLASATKPRIPKAASIGKASHSVPVVKPPVPAAKPRTIPETKPRIPKAAATVKASQSVSAVKPLAPTAKPRTSKQSDSTHNVSPSGAQKAPAVRVQMPKTKTVSAPAKVNVPAHRSNPPVIHVAPQKSSLPTTGASSGAPPPMKIQSDKPATMPVSHPAATASQAATAATVVKAATASGVSPAAVALKAPAIPPTGVAAAAVPAASSEDAEHSSESLFGVPDAGTVDGVLSAMANMPTAMPLSDVASAPSTEAVQQPPQQQALRRSVAGTGQSQANGNAVKTDASVPATNTEAAATAAEDDFLSNFLGQYGRNSGPKDATLKQVQAAPQKATPAPGVPPGPEALTAALAPLAPADIVVGPGAADVDALVSSFLVRSG